jgi:hypothetical protein
MTCSCGTKSCYICRAIITDYNHFDQTPHHHRTLVPNANGRCPLYSHNDELHVKNVIAAGEKAKEELTKKGVNLKHDPTKVAPEATRGGLMNPMHQDYYAQLQVPFARYDVPPIQPARLVHAANFQQHIPQIFLPQAQVRVPQINMPQFNFPPAGLARNGLPANQGLMLQFNFVVDDNQAAAHGGANAVANAQVQVQRPHIPRPHIPRPQIPGAPIPRAAIPRRRR